MGFDELFKHAEMIEVLPGHEVPKPIARRLALWVRLMLHTNKNALEFNKIFEKIHEENQLHHDDLLLADFTQRLQAFNQISVELEKVMGIHPWTPTDNELGFLLRRLPEYIEWMGIPQGMLVH